MVMAEGWGHVPGSQARMPPTWLHLAALDTRWHYGRNAEAPPSCWPQPVQAAFVAPQPPMKWQNCVLFTPELTMSY